MKKQARQGTYRSAEDTFLLADVLSRYRFGLALEIGVGEGYVTAELAKRSKRVVGTDIEIDSIRKTLRRLREARLENVDLVVCDGAKPIRLRFDVCAFNPPYLPGDMDITVEGGKEGIETTKEWFDKCANLLSQDGRIIFVASDLSNISRLVSYINEKGFETRTLARKKFFFEEICIVEARKKSQQ